MKPNDTEHQNAAQAEQTTPETAESAVDPIAVLEAEKDELRDKFLRLMADMENLRRRTEREVADARTYAVANFARDMLNVADNVRRGIETVSDETRASADDSFKSFLEGIELTERDLLKTLERHGVKKLDPMGQKFDPHVHQAMFEVPNPDVPSGTIVQVMQSGFVIGDRVLRPALVGVAKGGPKTSSSDTQETDNASSLN
jgi:molecular chaperone GrpE